MISMNIVVHMHNELIDAFGGIKGTRDIGALESALARPYATFDQIDLYPSAVSKAAAILESIIINHPFIDGNKRIAFSLMAVILMNDGFDINANEDEIYAMVISASTGEIKFDEIKDWIQSIVIILK